MVGNEYSLGEAMDFVREADASHPGIRQKMGSNTPHDYRLGIPIFNLPQIMIVSKSRYPRFVLFRHNSFGEQEFRPGARPAAPAGSLVIRAHLS